MAVSDTRLMKHIRDGNDSLFCVSILFYLNGLCSVRRCIGRVLISLRSNCWVCLLCGFRLILIRNSLDLMKPLEKDGLRMIAHDSIRS